MKNSNPPARHCYLDTHWKTSEAQVQAHHTHADMVVETLMKGGMTLQAAKEAVETLWRGGYSEGYDSAMYDANDHD